MIPLMTPVELDRVGMALGEVGFSLNIWAVESELEVQSQFQAAAMVKSQ